MADFQCQSFQHRTVVSALRAVLGIVLSPMNRVGRGELTRTAGHTLFFLKDLLPECPGLEIRGRKVQNF